MLLLTVTTYNGVPTDSISIEFNELGGTIGRVAGNHMTLPDRERTVSRVHAEVLFRNGAYVIQDRGSNPIAVNGRELGKGREESIRPGDTLQVGGYVISVTAAAARISSDPFADLFGDDGAIPKRSPVVEPSLIAPEGRRAATIPDDWDIFASDAPAPRDSIGLFGEGLPTATPTNSLRMDGKSTGSSHGESLDDLFGLGTVSGVDRLTGSGALSPFDATAPNEINNDSPFNLLKPPSLVPPPIPDDVSDLQTPWVRAQRAVPAAPPGAVLSWKSTALPQSLPQVPPAPQQRSEPFVSATQTASSLARPSVGESNQAELLEAFLVGIDVPDLRLEALTPGLMNRIGQLLRESTRGTVELLAARAALKREVRATVTMIIAKDNNPLKFSPSVDAALQHLLGPVTKGFTPPVAAVRDAYDDLRGHQIGMLAGMRAALEGVLMRFDPLALEAKLAPASGLAGLIPAARKAHLWAAFEALHAQISREAEDEFHELFGKAFVDAYEAHLDQLHQNDSSR